MIRKALPLTALIAFTSSVLFTSCDKTDDVSTTRALIADWKPSKIYVDNGNGVLDADEIKNAYEFKTDLGTLQFKDNQTGIYNTSGGWTNVLYPLTFFGRNADFTWSVNDRTQELTVTEINKNPKTTKLHFRDVNSFAILQSDSSQFAPMSYWFFFEKK